MADANIEQDEFSRLYREREVNAGENTAVDATTEDQSADATRIVPRSVMNRQERDIVLAGLLLDDELIDEKQLSQAVSDWTIHGNEPLLDHLVAAGLIEGEAVEALEASVTSRLQKMAGESSPDEASENNRTVLASTELSTIDRAATLLGIRSNLESQNTQQSRQFTGEYTLLRKLGQGGLGIVWLAKDNNLRRYVAIKEVTEAAKSQPAAVSRFRREAQITGRLEHPSIVPVHQFAEDLKTGSNFYVMRFLGKQTLQDAIDEYHERRESGDATPMQLHRLLSAFVSVCQAIAYAHSKDVVHRDLKPENIALDGFGQVIVLDWGLAKLLGEADLQDELHLDDSDAGDQSDRTIAGQVMGTPKFMSPEQAAGRIDEIDERTDVYGLGAILFSIVTGFAPHEVSHRSLSSTSRVSELLTAIMNQRVPRASELNPDAPPELEAICKRTLAKKRYARYESASELAEDVQRWIAGEPVSAYEEPWRKRAQRWIVNHRRISQLIGVLATILIVAAISMGFVSHQNRVAARTARFDRLHAEGRELEIRLSAHADTLTNHVRFTAELPPIQGIIDADTGDRETDEGSVWRERLQTIFRGLLRSNRDYLRISYASVDEEEVQELVRVERNASEGSFVRVLPESRLRSYKRLPNVDAILNLSPGDVFLIDSASVEQKEATTADANLTLLAATPIYDELTGSPFGLVLIEMNLERVLEYLLDSTNAAADVYVCDADGEIIMHYTRERAHEYGDLNQQIQDIVPKLEEFFVPSQPADTMTDNATYHASRVRLDKRRAATIIGLVLTLGDSR